MVKSFKLHKTKAFSLPEILIVLAIIGIITALTIIQVKPSEQLVGMQYKNAFRSLELAAYNTHDLCVTEHGEDCEFITTEKDLCTSLRQYFNYSKDSCQQDATLTTTGGAEFKVMYIVDNDTNPEEPKVALIRADINGSAKKPNRYWGTNGERTPDWVFFAVNSFGDTAPIGSVINDPRYIMAKVVYANGEKRSGVAMPYGDAQTIAFGENYYPFELYSAREFEEFPLSHVGESSTNSNLTQDESCVTEENSSYPKCTIEVVY